MCGSGCSVLSRNGVCQTKTLREGSALCCEVFLKNTYLPETSPAAEAFMSTYPVEPRHDLADFPN